MGKGVRIAEGNRRQIGERRWEKAERSGDLGERRVMKECTKYIEESKVCREEREGTKEKKRGDKR